MGRARKPWDACQSVIGQMQTGKNILNSYENCMVSWKFYLIVFGLKEWGKTGLNESLTTRKQRGETAWDKRVNVNLKRDEVQG